MMSGRHLAAYPMANQRFRSKIDLVFILIWAFLGVRLFTPAGNALLAGQPIATGHVLFPVTFLGVLCYFAVSTCYVVTDTSLVVRCGPFRSTVPMNAIYRLRATRTLVASPAMSVDRIEVLARTGQYVVISPADVSGFVAAVRRHVPAVEVDGIRAVASNLRKGDRGPGVARSGA